MSEPIEDCPQCHGEIDYKKDGEWKYCQDCCPHDENDHGICLLCEKDIFDDLIAAAEFAVECREGR